MATTKQPTAAEQAIGARIKALRGKRTQTAFGVPYGASKQTVRNWESGRNLPKQMALAQIAKSHGVSVESILSGTAFHPTSAGARPPLPPTSVIQREMKITDPLAMIKASLKALGIIDGESHMVMMQIEFLAAKNATSLGAAKAVSGKHTQKKTSSS